MKISSKSGHSTADSRQHLEPIPAFRLAVIHPAPSSDAVASRGTAQVEQEETGGRGIIALAPNRDLVLVPQDLLGSLQGLLCIGWAREYLVYPSEAAPNEIYALVRDALIRGNFRVIE